MDSKQQLQALLQCFELKDKDLDVLLARYVFNLPEECQGYCHYITIEGETGIYLCMECGAIVRRKPEQREPGPPAQHWRRIPHYTENLATVMPVIEAMRHAKDMTRVFFEVALQDMHTGYLEFPGWLIFKAQPRHYAIAALQALNILDKHGHFVEQKVENEASDEYCH